MLSDATLVTGRTGIIVVLSDLPDLRNSASAKSRSQKSKSTKEKS